MITSTSNPQVKNLQQLGRKAKLRNEQDVFLVEGTKMYLEAPAERIRKVYLSQSLYEEKGESFVKGHDVEILEDRVFAAACDTKTPQGVLCMVQQYHYRLEDLLKKKNPLLIILENLHNLTTFLSLSIIFLLCVTKMMVFPVSLMRCRMSNTSAAFCSSNDPVGSSARIMSHFFSIKRANASRCCSPPDSL